MFKFPCDISFVHRDSENRPPNDRKAEIGAAIAGVGHPYAPVVPVRMTEAWLLSDQHAIRAAANNPNGTVPLPIPARGQWEALSDPKSVLFELLRTASELPTRRLRKFRPEAARYRVAELTTDFSALRPLSAFATLEVDLDVALDAI